MHSAKRTVTLKLIAILLIAILLIAVMLVPIQAMAVEPRASAYLSSYSGYVYPAGWGKVQVWFHVDSVTNMDEIGALQVWLYESTDNENWSWVKSFEYQDYDGMLGYNNHYHDGHVEYSGTIGRYYKAYICVWAGENGEGDARYFWTNIEKATLFAG